MRIMSGPVTLSGSIWTVRPRSVVLARACQNGREGRLSIAQDTNTTLTRAGSDNQKETASRTCSCDTNGFDVGRHLSTVLIFGFFDFAVAFEVDHYPAIEFGGVFLKREVDHALYQGAILAVMLEGCFPSYHLRSCGSLQQRMLESRPDGPDSGINLAGGRVYEPCIGLRHRGDLVRTRVKIDCGEHRMNQRAEPSAAWTLNVGARNRFYLNAPQIGLAETRGGSKRSSCLNLNRGAARLSGCCGTALFPLVVGLLATRHLGAGLVGLQESSAAGRRSVLRPRASIPPGHLVGAYERPVEARSDAIALGGHPLRTPVDNALCAEAGRSWNRFRLAFRVVGGVQRRIGDLQPAGKWLIPTSRYNQKLACAGCGNIDKPHCFRLVSE